jgi:mevalonate kinase
MSQTEIVASAPAKVILAGGKAVNYGLPALATAVEPRAYCALRPLDRHRYAFVFNDRVENGDVARLNEFRKEIDLLRAEKSYDAISKIASGIGAPRTIKKLGFGRTELARNEA